jgi:hypothetical protein
MNGHFLPKWFIPRAGVVATVLDPFHSLLGHSFHKRINPVCAISGQPVNFA